MARRVDLIFPFDLVPGTAVTPRSDEIERARWSDADDPGLSPATRQALTLLAECESARSRVAEIRLSPAIEGGGARGGEAPDGVTVVDLSSADVGRG